MYLTNWCLRHLEYIFRCSKVSILIRKYIYQQSIFQLLQLSTNFTNATNLLTLTGLPDHLPAGAPRLLLHSPLHSLLLFFLFLNLFLLFFLLWTRFLLAIFLSRLRFGTISCRLTLFLFRPNTLAIIAFCFRSNTLWNVAAGLAHLHRQQRQERSVCADLLRRCLWGAQRHLHRGCAERS